MRLCIDFPSSVGLGKSFLDGCIENIGITLYTVRQKYKYIFRKELYNDVDV